ncbi:hypothetical protein GCM10029976_008940 [Kribbella albertanoniae]
MDQQPPGGDDGGGYAVRQQSGGDSAAKVVAMHFDGEPDLLAVRTAPPVPEGAAQVQRLDFLGVVTAGEQPLHVLPAAPVLGQ